MELPPGPSNPRPTWAVSLPHCRMAKPPHSTSLNSNFLNLWLRLCWKQITLCVLGLTVLMVEDTSQLWNASQPMGLDSGGKPEGLEVWGSLESQPPSNCQVSVWPSLGAHTLKGVEGGGERVSTEDSVECAGWRERQNENRCFVRGEHVLFLC